MVMTKKKIILAVALLLALAAAVFGVVYILNKLNSDPTPSLSPDYPAPPAEAGAEDIEENEEKLDAPAGGGAVGLVYSDEVVIDLSDKTATLRFDNPSRSTQNVALQLLIQDTVVFETGTLAPGKRITSVALKEGAAELLSAGVYSSNAKFVVYFYDPVTNERAVVNSEIAVTVTVQQ